MGDGWRATTLAEVEAVSWPGGLTWRPVRQALGLRAFGAGGWSAAAAGDPVVERHREDADGRGHQELYVVLRGRARFVLDGEVLDAHAGTLVAVPDPRVGREATALGPGTEALALGGPPVFEPAGSEWLMRARPLLDRDPGRARAILEDGRRELPSSPAIAFGLAQLHARAGDRDAASRELAAALRAEARLEEEAAGDPALAPLLRRG